MGVSTVSVGGLQPSVVTVGTIIGVTVLVGLAADVAAVGASSTTASGTAVRVGVGVTGVVTVRVTTVSVGGL